MRLKSIDLFCGCGGFSSGFKKAGYDIVFANDMWKPAMTSYMYNHPGVMTSGKPIEKLTCGEILRKTGLKRGEIDIIIGGPPCQGFSVAGSKKHDDERNLLWKDFFRIVKGLVPKVIVMENVRGITNFNRTQNGRVVDLIQESFEKRGYNFSWKLLDMADYGVPQHRMRVIMVANRLGKENGTLFPPKSHGDGRKDYVTVGESIMDLSSMTDKPEWSHRRMSHTPRIIERMKRVPEGEKCLREYFTFVYERLHRERPAITLVPGHSAFPVHPTEHRSLTVREAARLQTFPDKYRFFGNMVEQGIQVGNAVPPLFAYKMAMAIKKAVF